MDCAKGIGARVARPKKAIRNLQGLFRVLRPIPVIFAVPTTSGSGSETTIAAVITEVQTHHKASINDLQMMPRFALLDPCVTVGQHMKTGQICKRDRICRRLHFMRDAHLQEEVWVMFMQLAMRSAGSMECLTGL